MTEKTLTTENIKPALDALRGELAPWPVVAKKQDRLNTAQLNAANSGITSSLVAQIIANTAAIRALESAITGTGLRALVVASLPAVGTTGILYIVPVTTYDPETDADVVNYSNEYIWIPEEAGTASEGYYEQVGQTGIVINNGQLTITVNGTSVGTFTANQSGDTTAAITVPTNADYVDLTTDQTVAGVKTFSSTITGTASKAIADEDGTSIKTGYVNVAGNQTVSGQKTWSNLQTFSYGQIRIKSLSQEIGVTPSTSVIQYLEFADNNNVQHGKVGLWDYDNGASEIQLSISDKYKNGVKDATGTSDTAFLSFGFQYNGTKFLTFSGQVNNSIIPLVTNTYSLGSSSYQWSSVYAQIYYYNGTEFSNKFVTANTQQVITGFKIFNTGSWIRTPRTIDQTTNPSSFITGNGIAIWDNANYWASIEPQWTTDRSFRFVFGLSGFSTSETRPWSALIMEVTPENQALNLSAVHSNANLGTTANKWKTLNGINPGALSLPSDGSNGVEIDRTNWVYDGVTLNKYTPVVDGWLLIRCTDAAGNFIFASSDGKVVSTSGTGLITSVVFGLNVLLPVRANKECDIRINCSGSKTAYFYPCLGNV